MSSMVAARERRFWIIVVAVLATSMTWLALVSAVLTIQAISGDIVRTVVVARVLGRVALMFVQRGWALVPSAIVVWAMLGTLLAILLPAERTKREVANV